MKLACLRLVDISNLNLLVSKLKLSLTVIKDNFNLVITQLDVQKINLKTKENCKQSEFVH